MHPLCPAAPQSKTGYRVEVATLRRLEFENDAFALGDKLLDKWYGDAKDKKGLLLVLTSAKDGALTGGDAFMKARAGEWLMLRGAWGLGGGGAAVGSQGAGRGS